MGERITSFAWYHPEGAGSDGYLAAVLDPGGPYDEGGALICIARGRELVFAKPGTFTLAGAGAVECGSVDITLCHPKLGYGAVSGKALIDGDIYLYMEGTLGSGLVPLSEVTCSAP